jgi:hypothetical protein
MLVDTDRLWELVRLNKLFGERTTSAMRALVLMEDSIKLVERAASELGGVSDVITRQEREAAKEFSKK